MTDHVLTLDVHREHDGQFWVADSIGASIGYGSTAEEALVSWSNDAGILARIDDEWLGLMLRRRSEALRPFFDSYPPARPTWEDFLAEADARSKAGYAPRPRPGRIASAWVGLCVGFNVVVAIVNLALIISGDGRGKWSAVAVCSACAAFAAGAYLLAAGRLRARPDIQEARA